MTNGDQIQGSGGGQRVYSEEDVLALMNETAKRAVAEATKAAEATKNAQKINEDEDDNTSVINPKVVRQLKDTVAVFTALKDLSSNPLQKTIEETVGGMAASVVQSAFSPRGPPPKQDIVDKLLNSQFAYGLGSGLGQRAPELVETMGRTFGTEKAGQMMDNIIGKYGTGGGQPSKLSPGYSSAPSSQPSVPEQKADKQSEKELLLSLDPNNPEHVSAYAETQGGLPVDVARKMLMIHQDAFIEQLKRDGMNVDQISTQRGSRAQSSPPAQQPSHMQQTPMAQQAPPSSIRQDVPPAYPTSYHDNPIEPPSSQSTNDIEYAEYNDMTPGQDHGPNQQPSGQSVPPGSVDGQQVEMMKTFATDIGKVMGDMLNKIESLNNTVFTLQSEMNDMKKQGPKQPSSVHVEIPPRTPSYPPDMADVHVTTIPITRESIPVDAPSLETFEDQEIESLSKNIDIERPTDFFEEDVTDVGNLKQELEEDAKLSQPVPPVPVVQTVPVQPVLPVADITKPIIRQSIVQQAQQTQSPVVQPIQPIIQQIDKENSDDKDNIGAPKNESIVQESEGLSKIPIISDSKTSEEKNDNNFVAHTNQQLKLSREIGVHKKAVYRNIKPSFKKNDDKENKEDSNINREV
jgi:hypothetical protein